MSCFLTPTTPEQILGNKFGGKSFFEPNQYKVAIERCEIGYKSCAAHAEIFEEYAQLHEDHKKALARWRLNSEKKICQTHESGTNKKVWLNIVRTMELTGEWNSELAKKVREDVVQRMNSFRETEFRRSCVHSKKGKEFEKTFVKVQKPWATLLEEISQAAEELKTATAALNAARRAAQYCDSDVGMEKEKKEAAQASVAKREKKVQKIRDDYNTLLAKADKERVSYQKGMTDALETTHAFEKLRLKEYLKSFQTLQALIVTPSDESATKIKTAFTNAIKEHNADADITHWDEHYGSKNTTPWGVFEAVKE